jgi:hypothetical protein
MGTGSVFLTLLFLATSALPPDLVPMNSRNFKIPIQRLNDSVRSKIKELQLFVSDDQGATWKQVGTAKPDDKAFIFYAPADGVYWFNVGVVDAQGNREPPDLYQSTPRQKVLVDTAKPVVHILSADRQGEEIVVRWQIQEDHPDLASLKLEYRTAETPAWIWYQAPIAQNLSGEGRFRCTSGSPVSVRLQMADQCTNMGTDQKEIPAASSPPTIVAASAPGASPLPPPDFPSASTAGNSLRSASPVPPPNPVGLSTSARTATSGWPGLSSEPAGPVLSGGPVAPAAGAGPALVSPPPVDPRPLTENSWVPATGSRGPAAPSTPPSMDRAPALDNRYAANPLNNRDPYPPPAPPAPRPPNPGGSGTGPLVPLQVTNSTQVTLDYEITRVGPSGLGSVELYLTRDEGRTWERYAEDADLRPPMTVVLPGEGIYGLRLVLGSRAGLGRRPPEPGDPPQMRIEVDTTVPAAKLYPPQADPHRRDCLVLSWSVSDRNLALNPIALQWAERPDGPWQTIATDLPRDGPYIWQLPPNMPVRVYLRLLVKDSAGNIGMDETQQPVLIDLHEPEGQLLGIAGRAVNR